MCWHKLNLFIRSSIFFLYSTLSLAIYSLVVVAMSIVPLRYRYVAIRAYMRAYFVMLKWICRIDYRIEGLENIPKDRNGVLLSKHQSAWETFFLPIIVRDPAIVLKRELMWIPLFGWAIAASKPIAINRNNKTSAMQQVITQGRKCLQAGRWIIMFPEGTRVANGVVGHYKLGGARLAEATGYPVLPVAHNAGCYWPKRSFIKYPGTVRVVVGPLIESEGRSAEEVLALTKDWIESTMVRINQG
jgi:1-acyl-sn-glycerol-3-phosphate acyltransferase